MRHTIGLFHGQVGASYWKRYLSENMCVRAVSYTHLTLPTTEAVAVKIVIEKAVPTDKCIK